MAGEQRLARATAVAQGAGELCPPPHPGSRGKHGRSPLRWQARAGQTLTRARPFRRRAARTARPARVRMRSRNPCVFARRRLFGWNVRLLTGTPGTAGVSGPPRPGRLGTGASLAGGDRTNERYADMQPLVKPTPAGHVRRTGRGRPREAPWRRAGSRMTPGRYPAAQQPSPSARLAVCRTRPEYHP